MNWRGINRRYEAGVWAVPLALFPSFLVSAAFGRPSCIEPIILNWQETPSLSYGEECQSPFCFSLDKS